MAATLHSTMASAKPVFVPSLSITRPGQQQADGVGELEGEDDRGVVALGPAELVLQASA